MSDISHLQAGLQYSFKEPALLQTALTRRSWGEPNNERLEYLGDSVLGVFIADQLYHRFPKLGEGQLSRLRTTLVQNATLSIIGKTLKLDDHIILGQSDMKNNAFQIDSILADTFEAVIGAIYLDGGFDSACLVLNNIYSGKLDELLPDNLDNNPKSQLQEYLQKKALPLPEYILEGTAGPDHNPTFTVTCRLESPKIKSTVSQRTRKLAEKAAAEKVLLRLISADV
ncbi:MAG: ribonuclease III [Gammaproteobacteria bacterium]|nr:ribonuclease III [Gammaproteobacteria bacterium]MCY4228912.1 ribonuclease III [Gammaproteobacteria bacterium]MCY4313599.1 ribonuclease III [Gammaproteobacteria bacterium]